MTGSAASTTARYNFPRVLTALGHDTVSTPNSKEGLSVEPSVARNTLIPSARQWAQVFSGRPGPGFSPPAIVPKHHPMDPPLIVRPIYAPRKRRRRLQMVVSTISHWAFVRALAYDMRWSVRFWRWKPMTRKRRLWCAVRSSAKCSWPRVKTNVQHRVPITSTFNRRTFRVNGSSFISYSSRLNRL